MAYYRNQNQYQSLYSWKDWETFVAKENLPSHQVMGFIVGAFLPLRYMFAPIAAYVYYQVAENQAFHDSSFPYADVYEFLSWIFIGFGTKEYVKYFDRTVK